jgi:radical SAM superfamily enzyme YgiQ (UPF0313 family)
MKQYSGILFIGQSLEWSGRGIAGFRLRTAAKKAGYDILVVDICADRSEDELNAIIKRYNTNSLKFVGFSVSWIGDMNSYSFKWFNESFFKGIKENFSNLKLISGGHRMGLTSAIIPYTDYHFHGFSDRSFTEFLKHIHDLPNQLNLKKNNILNGYSIDGNIDHPVQHPDDIETILEPEDKFLPHQPVPIELSRGCIFRCAFCHHPYQGKKEFDSYMRSPESIARELKRNYDMFGTTRYCITDDTFNDSDEKIYRLQKGIELAKLPKFEFVGYIRPDIIVNKPHMINSLTDLGLKGAFVGIESMNQESRKAIGKGTDINKVIDVCHKLAERKVLIHAGMIVGLPYDTEETVSNAQEYFMSGNSPFRFWIWAGLFLKKEYGMNFDDANSTLDKNPGKYGYSFKASELTTGTVYWYNKNFDVHTAAALAKKFNQESFKIMKYAGWRVAGAWNIGLSDDEIMNNRLSINESNNIMFNHYMERSKLELEFLLK